MDDRGMQTPQTPGDAAAPAAAVAATSYIVPIGYSDSSDCGYCRRGRDGYSYYASSTSLTPSFYQKLVDRCWRRSGTILYRPNQKNSCCPHYTIRLDSSAFKPSKDQRQAVNRFNKYVVGQDYVRDAARLYPRSREQAKKRDNDFDLIERIHEAESGTLRRPPEPAHEFTVTLESDDFTEEKYAVFENYQRLVHQEAPDKITRNGFKRFLCCSPLEREVLVGEDGKPRQLGSFHQCYRLDGHLVAIGVLDLLPDCVSAVYFLYHESIHAHSPGKLGALREIALAVEGGYRWWYPGYYIHSCPKMRYKIDYHPQYVLDPETLTWDLLDDKALAVFDTKHYVSLSRERREQQQLSGQKGQEAGDSGLDSVPDRPDKPRGGGSGGDGDTEGGGEAGYSGNKDGDDGEAGADGKDGNGDGDSGANGAERDDEEEEDVRFLLASDMPGIPSLQQMEEVNMDNIPIRTVYSDEPFLVSELAIWDTQDVTEYGTLKATIAELVAALGPDLVNEFCLDFRDQRRR